MGLKERFDQLEGKDQEVLRRLRTRHPVLYVPAEMVRRYFTDEVSKSSAELSFFMLFSLFPLVMFVSAAMGRVSLSRQSIEMLSAFLPREVMEIIDSYLSYVTTLPTGVPFFLGLTLGIYLFARSINSLLRSINRIYRQPGRMGPWRFLASILFSLGFLITIVLALVLVVAGRVINSFLIRHLPALARFEELFNGLRYCVPLAFMFLILVLLYYIVPNRHVPLRHVLPGALFTMACWMGASLLFSYYVNNVNRYSLLYGYLAVEAAKRAMDGETLETLEPYVRAALQKRMIYFGIYSLKYAGKSGRIPSAAAFLGDKLGLKPVMKIFDHEITTAAKARGEQRLISMVADLVVRDIVPGTPYQLIYGAVVEDMEKLRLALTERLGYGPTGAYQIGAAIAANAGPRAVGVSFDIP